MSEEYCIIDEREGRIVYVGDYWDCKEYLRIFLEDDCDNYTIEYFEDLEVFE
jgi:hypothetical protein